MIEKDGLVGAFLITSSRIFCCNGLRRGLEGNKAIDLFIGKIKELGGFTWEVGAYGVEMDGKCLFQ
jgi:hypothetical protein